MLLTAELYGVSPSVIVKPVSVVHECADSCKIVQGRYTQCHLERETIDRRSVPLFKTILIICFVTMFSVQQTTHSHVLS